MAREKARITGRKPALPSALEQAAQVWKAEQDPQERLLFERGAEPSLVALQRMALQARPDGRRTDGEVPWRPLRWRDEDRPSQVVPNAAMVSRIAGHLRAREWARAMGADPRRRLGFDLEKWAEMWRQNKQFETRGLPGQPRGS